MRKQCLVLHEQRDTTGRGVAITRPNVGHNLMATSNMSRAKRSRSDPRSPASKHRHQNCSRIDNGRQRALLDQYLLREQSFFATVTANTAHIFPNVNDGVERAQASGKSKYIDFRAPVANAAPAGLHQLGQTTASGDNLVQAIPPLKAEHPTAVGLGVSKSDQATQAEQLDELVPIRLDIDKDQIRLRDTFTWNMHDRIISIKLFSNQLVHDFDLASPQSQSLVEQIQASIQDQLREFHPHIYIEEEALDPHLPYSAYKNDEMRIVIKLNITIGQYTLVDQFEWDINNLNNSPEEFAGQMTRELSLSGEFTTAIAHSIREQSQLFTHSLYVVGHPFDGRPIEDHELLTSFQPSPLPSSFRPYQAAREFTPCLYELNESELEKTELSMSREERRQKRSVNRRGGPALPDLKDRRRTIRSLLKSTVVPGAVAANYERQIFKRLTATSKTRKATARDGYDEFDDSESEDSIPGSPSTSTHLISSMGRARGVRGAASAAQAAMRVNFGRSSTPESAILHHHETRASGRKVIREDSSPEPHASLLVVLRLPPSSLRRLQINDAKSRNAGRVDVGALPRPGMARSHLYQGGGVFVSSSPQNHSTTLTIPRSGP